MATIRSGELEKLFTRATRCDAVLSSDWPSKLKDFIEKPENSLPVPGVNSVSLHYGRRVPKVLLLR